MNYKRLILILFLLALFVIPILIVYNKYHDQQEIGKQKCEERGDIYLKTLFENKVEIIYCQTNKTTEGVAITKITKISEEERRIS